MSTKVNLNKLKETINSLKKDGKFSEALSLLNKNSEYLLSVDPLFLIKEEIDIHLANNNKFAAIEAIKKYQALPLISVEVELYLRNRASEIIETSLKDEKKDAFSKETLRNYLLGDEQRAFFALNYLKDNYKKDDLDLFKIVLSHQKSDSIKRYALVIASYLEINHPFTTNLDNKEISVNPSLLEDPFTNEEVIKLRKQISEYSKNVTINRLMDEVLNLYLFNNYPDTITKDTLNQILPMLYVRAKMYLEPELNIKEDCLKFSLKEEEFLKFLKIVN
ncbi:MAG: hypothetical protein ACOX28_00900 [Bacilli bacterium]|jgi:hypothetical protein